MIELTEESLPAFLIDRQWLAPGWMKVERLSGGVSNAVFRVQTFHTRMVIKQARAQLQTQDPWFSDRERIFREMEVMIALQPHLPLGVVPAILHRDEEHFVYAMSHAPMDAIDWRTLLLQGKIKPTFGEIAGEILGQIHDRTHQDPLIRDRFQDRTIFDQLRIDPFYRTVCERVPEVAQVLNPLIEQLQTFAITLCHGDFSPKNLLLHADGFVLVDYETAHFGDPSFDLGFFLSHLVLKRIHLPELREQWNLLIASFWRGYQSQFCYRPFDLLMGNAIAHLGACLLARVDGKSPAPYLKSESEKNTVRRIAKTILLDRLFLWDEVRTLINETGDVTNL